MFSSAERKIFTSFTSIQNAFRSAIAKEMENDDNTPVTPTTPMQTNQISTEHVHTNDHTNECVTDEITSDTNIDDTIPAPQLQPISNVAIDDINIMTATPHALPVVPKTSDKSSTDASFYNILKPPMQSPPRPPISSLLDYPDSSQNVCFMTSACIST